MGCTDLRPIGTEFTVVYPPDLASTGDAGDHPHEFTYRVAHVVALVGGKEEIVEEWNVVRKRC